MVTSVSSLGRSGLYDWVIQRVSAVILASYVLFIVGFLIANPDLQYQQWSELHSSLCMRIFNLLTLMSFVGHAWIGMWGVLTDYVTTKMMGKPATVLRVVLQLAMIVALLVMLIIGINIFWS